MALFPGGLLLPELLVDWGSTLDLGSLAGANAVGEGHAFIFRIPLTGTLERVAYYGGGSGTGTIRVSVQGVTSSGLPDDTPLVYREAAVAAAAWTETGILSDDGTDTGNLLDVTEGQLVAVVVEYTAFTSGLHQLFPYQAFGLMGFPYSVVNVGAGWVKTGATSKLPNIALKYDTGEYEVPRWCLAMSAEHGNTTTLALSGSPDEAGVAVVPPWDATCDGAFFLMRPETPCTITLYDNTWVVLAQNTYNPESCGLTGGSLTLPSSGGRHYWFSWDEVELTAGQQYVVAVRPTGAGDVEFYDMPYASAGILAGSQGGSSGSLATRTGGSGAFSVSTTRKGVAALHLSGVD